MDRIGVAVIPLEERVAQFLEVNGQRAAVIMPDSAVKNSDELITRFLARGGFERMYVLASEYLRRNLTPAEISGFIEEFKGALFEELSFGYLQSNAGLVTLSPKQTLEFFKMIYPDAKLIREDITDSLNIGNPDGLMLDNESGHYKIAAICEYTALPSQETVSLKSKNFRTFKKDHPAFFTESTELFFVVSRGYDIRRLMTSNLGFFNSEISMGELQRLVAYFMARPGAAHGAPLASLYETAQRNLKSRRTVSYESAHNFRHANR